MNVRSVLKLLPAAVVAFVPTVVSYRILRAEEGIVTFVIYVSVALMLAAAGLLVKGKRLRTAIGVVEGVVHLTGAIVIVVTLNLTPATAYLAWFRLVGDGNASGVLSTMFTMKICFFATLGAVEIMRGKYASGAGFAIAMSLLVLYAVFQIRHLAIGSLSLAGLSCFAAVIGRFDRAAYRRVVLLVEVLIFAGLIAYPLSLAKPGRYNPLVSPTADKWLAAIISRIYPDFPFLYNMPGYGHNLGENEIGGQPSLTARPVFTITATPGETLYLRTAVYEFYTGRGWAQNSSRFTKTDESPGVFTRSEPRDLSRPVRVEVMIDFFSSVPHTLDTTAIRFHEGDFPMLRYGNFDVGFVFDVPVVRGTTFYLERGEASGDVPLNLGSTNQLPDGIPEGVRSIANALDTGDTLRTAQNIKNYLAANYYYTLDASNPRRNEDPAFNFLMSDGGGYCVHFATAFALLARMAGIPARYVTGFLVNIPYDSDTALIPGYASHAWVEIWVPGKGWTVQEATPPMAPEFFDDPFYFELYNPFGSAYTERQLEQIMGDRVSAAPSDSRAFARSFDFAVALTVVCVAAAVAVFVWFFLRSSYSPVGKRRRFRLAVSSLLRASRGLSSTDPSLVGWVAWSAGLVTIDAAARDKASRTVTIIHSVFFGRRSASRRDIRFVRGVTRLLGKNRNLSHPGSLRAV